MLGNLYIIKNTVNSKVYIGKTYNSLEARFKDHIKPSNLKKNQPLATAIRAIGAENFYIQLLGQYEQGELENKEIEAIKFYNSYVEGYNATLGGEGTRTLTVSDSEVLLLYESLQNQTHVAQRLNISVDSVKKILNAYQIDTTVAYRPQISDEKILEEYKVAQSIKAVARNLKISEQFIRKVLNKHDSNTRGRGARKVLIIENNLIFDSVLDCASWFLENNITKSKNLANIRDAIYSAIKAERKYFNYTLVYS